MCFEVMDGNQRDIQQYCQCLRHCDSLEQCHAESGLIGDSDRFELREKGLSFSQNLWQCYGMQSAGQLRDDTAIVCVFGFLGDLFMIEKFFALDLRDGK